jgi:hypothetical protein
MPASSFTPPSRKYKLEEGVNLKLASGYNRVRERWKRIIIDCYSSATCRLQTVRRIYFSIHRTVDCHPNRHRLVGTRCLGQASSPKIKDIHLIIELAKTTYFRFTLNWPSIVRYIRVGRFFDFLHCQQKASTDPLYPLIKCENCKRKLLDQSTSITEVMAFWVMNYARVQKRFSSVYCTQGPLCTVKNLYLGITF